MSDYTPTTENVRYGYVANSSEMRSDKKLYEEFDRWLAEVKAQAWADGYTAGTHDWRTESLTTPNPYRGKNK